MVGLLMKLLQQFVMMCLKILPVSPFGNITVDSAFAVGLGWLNWFFPVSDCLGLIDVWLLAVGSWMLFRFVYKRIGGIGGALTGMGS